MLETIKSYLVSLGFQVDKNTYNDATKAIDKVGEGVAKFAGSTVTKFALAGTAVASFVATAVIGIGKFISDLGEAQIANEKLARQMWISEDSAMAFSSTLKALHASLQDLYLSPTLAGQFQELMKETNSLKPPAEFKDQMKLVQSITFEFKRMKLEATYALQWIGYYFIKYMQGPILEVKKVLSEINNTIIKTMPHWTKIVAEVMSWFARMGIAGVRAIKDLKRVFDDIGESIPKNVKLIGGAIVGLLAIIETGPIGIMIAILSAALLLLDDFYTYLDGGESAFGPFWQKLIDFYNQLKDSSAFKAFKDGMQEAFDFVSGVIDTAKNLMVDFWTTMSDNGTIDNYKQAMVNTFDIISSLIQTIIGWIQKMYDTLQEQGVLSDLWNNFKGITSAVYGLFDAVTEVIKKILELGGTKQALQDIGDFITDIVVAGFKDINDLIKSITDGITAITKLLKGDWKGAWQSTKDALNDFLFRNPHGYSGSYIFPSSSSVQNNNQKANVSVSPTYNIYGTDTRNALDATSNYTNVALVRTTRGVFS